MSTSRERVLESIAHKEPDSLPATLYAEAGLRKKLPACDEFENDTLRILWDIEDRIVDEKNFYDPFGVRWMRSEGAYFFEDPPLDEPDASRIPRIELVTDADDETVRKARLDNPDKFIFYQFTMTFGERLWALRGMENYLMDLVIEPSFTHEALDILLDMHFDAIDRLIRLPIDGITFGDDFGSQKGLMISPKAFREFYKGRLGLMYEKARDAGLVVGAHSCGDNTEIMADYVDIGLQVFHPLQPECMDISTIKREFGRDLTFRGGIGVQGVVVHGTPEQVRSEVMNAARILSEGGGYLLEPCKPLPAETPIENAAAFIESMREARSRWL